MLVDTIDLFQFVPLSVTLTFAGDHRISAMQLLLT